MMVLVYGYSLMYILSGLMAYELNGLEVFGISLACYVFDKVIFKTLRRLLTIVLTVLITLATVTYILYRLEQLVEVWMEIVDFTQVYYLSVTVDTVSIDVVHQVVLIVFIGIILMRVLEKFIQINQYNYLYLMGISVILVVVGYLNQTMGSSRDHEAFMILSATMILYYFYNYYRGFYADNKSFKPLMTTVATFIIIIVIGARMLYSWDPRPLTTPVVKPKFQVSSDVATEVFEQDKMSYYRQDSFTIQESFEFQDIEVMRVKTSNLRYLKAETYEIYDSGSWLRDEDLQYLDNDGDTIQNSTLFDQIDYRDFYDIENIEVTIRGGINTNVLFMANYGTSDTSFDAGIRVMYDPRRGIYFADKLLEPNYSYNFNAVIPAYGNPSFDELVRQRSDLAVPSGLDVYKIMPEEGYSDLVALTESIVDGIDNKYDQALAIENYLKSNYVYSESPGSVPEGVDPVNHFLFETGEGFCQQFSSAFILMSRSVGIPTRYATGFYVDIFEPEDLEDAYMMEMDFMRDGTTSVLDSDSHTWAEAYFPEVGWIMFEATPGRLYRKDVVAGPDLNLDDLDPRGGEGVGTFNLDWNYVYTLFGVIAIGVLLYMLSIFYKKRKAIKHRTPPKEKNAGYP